MLPKYILKKCLTLFLTIFFVVTLTFFLMKLIPGDPFTDEKALSAEMHQFLREHYGLDESLKEQYFKFLTASFSGNLGPSLKYPSRSVYAIIKKSFPISAILGLQALLLTAVVGISLGIIAALKQNRWQDRLITVTTTFGLSVPSFILAVLLQYLFAIKWKILPIARFDSFATSILPTISLSLMPIAYMTRLVRCNVLDVLKADYIKTAYSKGLSKRKIIFKHVLKNALTPLIPYFGQLTATILLGSFVIEKIFGIPGLGSWFVNSVGNRDYTMIMATTMFYSFILLFCIFISDLLYLLLDPRSRTSAEK